MTSNLFSYPSIVWIHFVTVLWFDTTFWSLFLLFLRFLDRSLMVPHWEISNFLKHSKLFEHFPERKKAQSPDMWKYLSFYFGFRSLFQLETWCVHLFAACSKVSFRCVEIREPGFFRGWWLAPVEFWGQSVGGFWGQGELFLFGLLHFEQCFKCEVIC